MEENFDIPDEDFNMDEDNPVKSGGGTILEKPLINTFFDPEEQILVPVEKTMKGYEKIDGEWVYNSRPIARTVFINKTINMLRSVINTINFNSKLGPKQIDQIMIEKNIEYIQMCKIEPKWSLADEDVEMAVNIFDHALQMYMGIVENGRVSDIITQIATGNYDRDAFRNINEKNTGLLGGLNIFGKK